MKNNNNGKVNNKFNTKEHNDSKNNVNDNKNIKSLDENNKKSSDAKNDAKMSNKNESKAKIIDINSKNNSSGIDVDSYLNSLKRIERKIEKLDSNNLDSDLINEIVNEIDKKLADTNKKISDTSYSKEDSKKLKEIYQKFLELNQTLLRKIMFNNPFENFIYSDEEDKESILKEFFFNINKDVHWLDLEEIDFTTSPDKIISEKNRIISSELIKILEANLNLRFSKIQKESLMTDFTQVAESLEVDYDEIMEECKKIKTVTSTKLLSRPSYKNFISKNELNNLDPTKKISTIRFNFLNYLNLTEKQKIKEISTNLNLHLKSLKELLEDEREELNRRMKTLYILIVLSLMTGVVSPTACLLLIISVGSAAAYTQSKLISANHKIDKLNAEITNIEKGESELIDSTYEKLEETSNELLENEDYLEVSELYKKKKKSRLNKKEMDKQIEEQIRLAIINNLNALSDQKKDKIIERSATNKIDASIKTKVKNIEIEKETSKNNKEVTKDEIVVNMEIDL